MQQPQLQAQASQPRTPAEETPSAGLTFGSALHKDVPSGTIFGDTVTSSGISPILLWGGIIVLLVAVAITGFLIFRPSPRAAVSDADIEKTLRAKFAADPNLSKCSLEAHSEKGVVTLIGLVNSDADKTAATSMAAQQEGVKQVNVFEIVVKGASTTENTGSTGAGQASGSAASQEQVASGPRTITVPANQVWTATGILLKAGDVVAITANGKVSMGTHRIAMTPEGGPPNCGSRGGFPAGELPCWSLIGRIGEEGPIFYVGSGTTVRVPKDGPLLLGVNDDKVGDDSGSWTATIAVNAAKSSSPTISVGGIRGVDFRNFEYHSDYLDQTVRVSNGEWQGTKKDDTPGDYFSVVKITYGDLTGDGNEEAAVLTETAYGGMSPNAKQAQLFVFSMSPEGPRLLQNLPTSGSNRGEGINWSRISDIRIKDRHLEIASIEGECSACADWAVTAIFQWQGDQFVRTSLVRRKCQSPECN